ncbi:hypothetical protein BC332_29773 [Capsicum chinense]|nr:hypothetical protein BC332_29773 [Capsicum chinense]
MNLKSQKEDLEFIMRRNLLKLVRVREFAPEAEFHSLSVSYTLPNVICSYCNDCRDLDLCRDRALISHEWRCAVPQCGQPYDREAMENALVQIVRQRETIPSSGSGLLEHSRKSKVSIAPRMHFLDFGSQITTRIRLVHLIISDKSFENLIICLLLCMYEGASWRPKQDLIIINTELHP